MINYLLNNETFLFCLRLNVKDKITNIMLKLEKGTELYDYSGKKYIVSKVGKKYFEVEGLRNNFVIETLRENSISGSAKTLADKKTVFERLERNEIEKMISIKMSSYRDSSLSLQQLRLIRNIIEEKPTLEEYLRSKVNVLESALDYAIATDTVRMWLDMYNDTYLKPKDV